MNGLQRRIAASLLAFGTVAALGGTAYAAEKVEDSNLRFQTVLANIDNPCTPALDDITLVADWHAIAKRWDNPDGSWRYQGSARSHLAGSAADGTEYRGTNHFRAHTRVGEGVVHIISDEKHLLVGQGAAPNFTLRMKIEVRFALDGSFSSWEVLKEDSECRG